MYRTYGLVISPLRTADGKISEEIIQSLSRSIGATLRKNTWRVSFDQKNNFEIMVSKTNHYKVSIFSVESDMPLPQVKAWLLYCDPDNEIRMRFNSSDADSEFKQHVLVAFSEVRKKIYASRSAMVSTVQINRTAYLQDLRMFPETELWQIMIAQMRGVVTYTSVPQ